MTSPLLFLGEDVLFTAWHPDGPNGFDQSCATTDNRGEWNDESCTAYFPPVCYFGEYHLLPPVYFFGEYHLLPPVCFFGEYHLLPPVCFFGEYHLLPPVCYRSGTVNSNTVNSKFHLIRSYCKYLARILSFHV